MIPSVTRGPAGPSGRHPELANFAAAADEALLPRISSGIHFRLATRDARAAAEQIAAHVREHAAQASPGQLPN